MYQESMFKSTKKESIYTHTDKKLVKTLKQMSPLNDKFVCSGGIGVG